MFAGTFNEFFRLEAAGGIIIGSLVSGVCGFLVLKLAARRNRARRPG